MPSEPSNWRSLLDAGREEQKRGNLVEAERLIRAAIDSGGRDDDLCWLFLASVLDDKRDFAAAADAYRQAIQRDDRCWLALRGLGRMLSRLGQYDDAEQSLRRSIELDEHSLTWVFLGDAYALQDREPEARRAYHRALEVDPADETAYYSLGILDCDACAKESAAANFSKAIEIDDDYPAAHRELAFVLTHVDGEIDAAEHHARRALEIEERDERTHAILGNILIRTGRSDEAEQHYARAVELAPDEGHTHRMLAKCLAYLGKANLARASFWRALELEPDSHFNYVQYAEFLQEQRKATAARRIIEAGLERLPDSEDLIRANRELGGEAG